MHELLIEENGCVRTLPSLDIIQKMLEKFSTSFRSRYSVDLTVNNNSIL